MNLRIGILGVSHMHVWSYVSVLKQIEAVEVTGFWEASPELAATFSEKSGLEPSSSVESLLAEVEAVVICSTNVHHAELSIAASKAGKHVLSEKPLATTVSDGEAMIHAAKSAGKILMTGFPCRFSPAYQKLKAQIQAGAIGKIIGINATNRGTCPFGWFVDKVESGGGAMIDHVVHVADLLFDLLGQEPVSVIAHVGNNTYGQEWEDSALLLLTYKDNLFVTLDSSWSRPAGFKTWGDVTLSVTGESGMLEADLFGQSIDVYQVGHSLVASPFGSDCDKAMIKEFVNAIRENREPLVTGEHGLAAVKIALRGYESLSVEAEAYSGTV